MHLKQGIAVSLSSSVVLATLLVGGVAFAQSAPGEQGSGWGSHGRGGMHRMMPRGIFGTVSAESGTTLTVESKGFGPNATAATYSVDASKAAIVKDNATSSLSSIAVGDTVMVRGTVNGTSVAATLIRDGLPPARSEGGHPGKGAGPIVQGNGQPIVGGSVSVVSGSTLTVTNKGNATYSVDASNAFIDKNNATSSLSAIAVGDEVIVQGTVNGSSIAASSIVDRGAPEVSQSAGAPSHGVFGAIGGFFRHLFGFF